MRKILFALSLVIAGISNAQVTCSPGALKGLVNDKNITSLTVNGKMDARDFRFIADSLQSLKQLDLGNVNITEYHNGLEAIFGTEYYNDSLTVPTMALAGMKNLQSLTLPRSATALGMASLAGCTSLKTLQLPEVLATIGDYALSGCSAITTLTLPATTVQLGKGAMSRCTALKTVTINGTNTSNPLIIDDEAFLGCISLTAISLGNNIGAIGNEAFAGTGLVSVDLSQQNALQQIGDWAFVNTNVASASMPRNITNNGRGAFLYNKTLASANGYATVPAFTFTGNTALTDIDIAGSDTIGDYAFYGDYAMASITLPQPLTFIGTKAMAGMTGLKSIHINAQNAPALGESVWYGVNQPAIDLTVPYGCLDAYSSADQWRDFNIIEGFMPGDADHDGRITVADLNIIINIILGLTDIRPAEADADCDGSVSIKDVNAVINMILGIEATAQRSIPNTNDRLMAEPIDINLGETRSINVEMVNSSQCSAIQCDITLPQGLSLSDITVCERAGNHILTTAQVGNATRIIIYSADGQRIEGNSGALFTLEVTADERLSSESKVTIDCIIMADMSHKALFASPCTATVNNVSGVNDLTADNDAVTTGAGFINITTGNSTDAQIVNINGTTRNISLQAGENIIDADQGIYIVRLNGKSYKVAVK